MARTREKMRGRREEGSFAAIPHAVLDSANYLKLSAHAVKLLIDLCAQFKGTNNGDLAAPWSKMQGRGWKSRDTLGKAIRELLAYGMIDRTRHGGEGRAGRKAVSLFAVTWRHVDSCDGKLDVAAGPSSGRWRKPPDLRLLHPPPKTQRPTRQASQFDTPAVSMPPKRVGFDTPTVLIAQFS